MGGLQSLHDVALMTHSRFNYVFTKPSAPYINQHLMV
jgi:hypothetical protein